jgi:hypothetical protein
MKRNSITIETALFEDSDLFVVLKNWAQENAQDFSKYLINYLSRQGYKVAEIQRTADLSRVIAKYTIERNEGVTLIGTEQKSPVQRSSNAGFSRQFTGFYQAILDIVHEHHALGQVSFDKLYDELLKVEVNGKKSFWYLDESNLLQPMPRWRFNQYLCPSQIDPQRNVKFRGIRVSGSGLQW